MERRHIKGDFEVRAGDTGDVIVGHAPVWNRYSQNLGGFVEQVAPGACSRAIVEDDIRGLKNHDPSLLLGRNKSGTMRLFEDNVGLRFEIDVPDTTVGRDLVVSAKRGDITGASFSFRVIDQEWGVTDSDFPLRTIKSMQLFDVGPVTFPAYLDSESGLRALPEAMRREALAGLVSESRSIDQILEADDLRAFIGEQVPPVLTDTDGQRATHPSIEVARARLLLADRRTPAA
jgi:HK97 family phage prohead protease